MNIAPRRQAPWWLFQVLLGSGYKMRLHHWDKPDWKPEKMWGMTRLARSAQFYNQGRIACTTANTTALFRGTVKAISPDSEVLAGPAGTQVALYKVKIAILEDELCKGDHRGRKLGMTGQAESSKPLRGGAVTVIRGGTAFSCGAQPVSWQLARQRNKRRILHRPPL